MRVTKIIGGVSIGLLALTGCAVDKDAAPVETTTVQITEEAPEPAEEETPAEDPDRALILSDFTATTGENSIMLEAGGLYLEVPLGYSETTGGEGHVIFRYADDAGEASFVLTSPGVSGLIADGGQYAKALNDSGNLGAASATFVTTVEFGSVKAIQLSVSGGSGVSTIYAFDYDGRAYELTLNAPDSARLQEMQAWALETRVSSPQAAEPTDEATE
ncbi:MAG: hypothetical protein GX483_00240 [Actinomycetaceae bacterium]|nr:hypothetical protein [Actinomycetaceae bacterium]